MLRCRYPTFEILKYARFTIEKANAWLRTGERHAFNGAHRVGYLTQDLNELADIVLTKPTTINDPPFAWS